MKKIILMLCSFILSIMSVYAQAPANFPTGAVTVVPNSTANPTAMTITWPTYVQGTTPALNFVLERSPNIIPASFRLVTTITNLTTVSYVDNVTPDTYCYRLRAVSAIVLPATVATFSAYTTPVCFTLPQPVTPTTLTASTLTPSAPTSIDLTWLHANTDATTTRFLIERSTTSATTGFSFLATVTVNNPSPVPPATLIYTDGSLTPSNYYYRVRAANAFLFSAYSNVASVIIPPLAAPTTLAVVPNGTISTSNALTWGATPNATAYDVQVSTSLTGTYVSLATVTTTDYTHLTTGGNYCYRVRATVGSAVSPFSNVVCTPIIPCASAFLLQPTSIAAVTNVQVTNISVTWDDNAAGETGYKIFRSNIQYFSLTLDANTAAAYATVATQNLTGYADNAVAANTAYYYVVAPYCGTTVGQISDEVELILGLATATEFTANARANEFAISLEWLSNVSNVNREASYEVERSLDTPTPNWRLLKTVIIPADTVANTSAGAVRRRYRTFDDGTVVGLPLLPSTKYCYRVRSTKIIGGIDVFSEYSTVACATTPIIEPPTDLLAIAEIIEDGDYIAPTGTDPGTTPKIIISWRDNSIFETKYIIERKRDIVTTPPQLFAKIDSVETKLGEKISVRYVDIYSELVPRKKGLVPSAKYCYRVRAKLVGGSVSNYSNEACAVAFDVSTSVDVKLSNQVKLYPNPASKNFMISFEGVNICANKAEIINVVGQKVAEQNLSSTTTEMSLQNLKAGLYYVRIQSDKGTIVKKLVIEN